jgi:hypothetical protein
VKDNRAVEDRAGRRVLLMRVGRILLAPVLATVAVGVHFVLNVPPGGAKVSTRDQGAEKKEDKKKKKPKPKKKGFESRPIGEVQATFERYAEAELDAEPVKSAWARPHQTLVNQVVTKAREAAFEGAPEEPRVSVDDVVCKTVRCRFVLRGPFAHEVDLLSDTLSKLQIGTDSVWRHYSATKISPPKPDQPKDDTYLQVTVAFMEDNMDSARMKVPAGQDDGQVGGGAEDVDDAQASGGDEPDTNDAAGSGEQ